MRDPMFHGHSRLTGLDDGPTRRILARVFTLRAVTALIALLLIAAIWSHWRWG